MSLRKAYFTLRFKFVLMLLRKLHGPALYHPPPPFLFAKTLVFLSLLFTTLPRNTFVYAPDQSSTSER